MSGWGHPPSVRSTSYGQTNTYLESMVREAANYQPQREQRIVREVGLAVSQYRSLAPKLGVLVLRSGEQKQLLKLQGTIPINYNGGQYNIPIMVWVTEYHPDISPLVFVIASSTMMIPPNHPFVRDNGLVHHPYLLRWQGQTHTIGEMLSELVNEFSKTPPLYASPRVTDQERTREIYVHKLEKTLKSRVAEESKAMELNIDSLHKERSDLEEVSKDLIGELENLNIQNMSTSQKIEQLKDEIAKLSTWIDDNREVKDVDSILNSRSIPHRQMIECHATNLAYEDLHSELEEALQLKRIPVQDYLMEVERLRRLQFFQRAHYRKIKLVLAEDERETDLS
eukprot:Plantae.Rhodophyta-Purpureofilum_apyrenoidigerum.ctg10966.p1 GENE.Plantae.Rhodophyta-Purpureofilum_apyrenoidigerum.ctg10966~~Plantae.Rhodophyta-Purpureofilum_apyrenoidigerum.ctg10966.p1  ORF type:complete len:339 (-),score=53.05 Plantae.Rhodophyta-Purpureofilum_apyrenoidigerum.ctg10966:1048-2064(-)